MGVSRKEGFRKKPVACTQKDDGDSPEESVVNITNGQYYDAVHLQNKGVA